MSILYTARLGALAVVAALLGSGCATSAQAQSADSSFIVELLNRVSQLEDEVRLLRGDIELLRHDRDQGQSYDEGRMRALEQRVEALASRAAPEPAYQAAPEPAGSAALTGSVIGPGAPSTGGAGNAPLTLVTSSGTALGEEEVAYDAAFGALKAGRYSDAAAGFEELLRGYPNGEYAASAQYWLGEAHYVTGNYAAARDAFIRFGVNYASDPKVPDALFKLGQSYIALGDRAGGRDVLEKLIEIYPSSQAANAAAHRLQELR